MSTMHKSAVAHIGAPPAVTWEAVTVRLWPNWAAAGFHGPARDDQQMRFSMHHGSGAGRSEWTLLVTPAGGGRSVINCEPHRVQKIRNFPGEDSNLPSSSSPLVHENLSRGTPASEEKAAPCALRQDSQWQWRIGPSGASTL